MFVMGWNGGGFTRITGVLTVAVLGVRRVVGMGGVFARILLVVVLVVRVLVMPVFFLRCRARRRYRG
jgi:hypothetical protein